MDTEDVNMDDDFDEGSDDGEVEFEYINEQSLQISSSRKYMQLQFEMIKILINNFANGFISIRKHKIRAKKITFFFFFFICIVSLYAIFFFSLCTYNFFLFCIKIHK